MNIPGIDGALVLVLDSKAAQQIRWLNVLLQLLDSRKIEITRLKTRMDIRTDLNDTTLIAMIRNIHHSEMSFIRNCRSVFSEKLNTLNTKTFDISSFCFGI